VFCGSLHFCLVSYRWVETAYKNLQGTICVGLLPKK
jgi:hypothetical protein